jgi:hypothetical protein
LVSTTVVSARIRPRITRRCRATTTSRSTSPLSTLVGEQTQQRLRTTYRQPMALNI